jgi:hypothetical protein
MNGYRGFCTKKEERMEQAEKGLKYKMQHVGDILVDSVETMLEGWKKSLKGVCLTYEIHSLQAKKKRVIYRIGERLVSIRKTDPTVSGISADDEAIKYFSEFDKIEERLEASIAERESRVNRWRFVNECNE